MMPSSALQNYILNALGTTFTVCLMSIATSMFLGAIPAWITHRFHFKGRPFASFSALLPLTAPPVALIGVYQESTGWAFFEGIGGMGVCIGAATAPFVFILLRVALNHISPAFSEAAQTLGHSPLRRLFSVHIPLLALPFLASAALIACVTFSDFAVAERAGVETFSVAFTNIWQGTLSYAVAADLAALVFLIFTAFFTIAAFSVRNLVPRNPASGSAAHKRIPLSRTRSVALFITCIALAIPGFFYPTCQTVFWAWNKAGNNPLLNLGNSAWGSLINAAVTMGFVLATSTCIAFALHKHPRVLKNLAGLSLFFYGLPALILVLAAFSLTRENGWIAQVVPQINSTTIPISAISALQFAPFLLLPLTDALHRVPLAMAEAGRVLGCTRWQAFRRVTLPLLAPAFIAGMALIFVESMKEVTIAQALRPFNFNTLSLRIYGYASAHQTLETSVWVLALQLILLYPMLRVHDYLDKENH